MGSSDKVTIGYKYKLGMHMILADGRVDAITALRAGDRLFWSGNVTNNQTISINQPDLFGGEKKEGGIVGDLDIEFGDDTQSLNGYLAEKISGVLPAFRRSFGIVWKGGQLTAMTPYIKKWSADLLRIPAKDWYPEKSNINNGSANGAHILYEAFTNNDWGLGYSVDTLNDADFRAVADTLYDESFGLSFHYTKQTKVLDFITQIVAHINAINYVDPRTGTVRLKLIRDDYDIETLPVIDRTSLVELVSYDRVSPSELVNEVSIIYKPRGETQNKTVSAQDLGSINSQTMVSSETITFVGLDDGDLAARVAQRELRQKSTPLSLSNLVLNRKGISIIDSFEVGVFVLNLPEKGINNEVMRVIDMNLGSINKREIEITAIQDVFSLEDTTYTEQVPTLWEDPIQNASDLGAPLNFEAPYWDLARQLSQTELLELDPDGGFLQSAIPFPAQASPNYDLWIRTDEDGDPGSMALQSSARYCGIAQLEADLDYTTTSNIAVINQNYGPGEGVVNVGTYAYIVSQGLMEVVRLDYLDRVNGTMTIGRGCLDTIPKLHLANDYVFFMEGNDGRSTHEFLLDAFLVSAGSMVTGLSRFAIDDATESDQFQIKARHYRPYPPGNFKINGQDHPDYINAKSDIIYTWAHRDRQQQLATIIDTTAGNIGPELGVSYNYSISLDGGSFISAQITGNTATHSSTDELGTASKRAYAATGIYTNLRPNAISYENDSIYEFVYLNAQFAGSNGDLESVDISHLPNIMDHKNGAAISQGRFKTGASSLYLDGVDNYVLITPVATYFTTPHISFTKHDFVIEGSIYPESFDLDGSDRRCIISGGNNSFYLVLETSGALTWGYNGVDIRTSTQLLTIDEWSYFSIERKLTTLYCHVNGVNDYAISDVANYESPSDVFPAIGAVVTLEDVSEAHFQGNIDQLRITKGRNRGYALNTYAPTINTYPFSGDSLLVQRLPGLNPQLLLSGDLVLSVTYSSTFPDIKNSSTGELSKGWYVLNPTDQSVELFAVESTGFEFSHLFTCGEYTCIESVNYFGRCLTSKLLTADADDWEINYITSWPVAGWETGLPAGPARFPGFTPDDDGRLFSASEQGLYGIVISSTDGINWQEMADLNPDDLDEYNSFNCNKAVFLNGTYLLLGSMYAVPQLTSSSTHCLYSIDLVNWQEITIPLNFKYPAGYNGFSGWIDGAEYINNTLIFHAHPIEGPDAGEYILASTDFGENWTDITPDELGVWTGIIELNGTVYASSGERWATTTDGISWTIFDFKHPNYTYDIENAKKSQNNDIYFRTDSGVIVTSDMTNFSSEFRYPVFVDGANVNAGKDPVYEFVSLNVQFDGSSGDLFSIDSAFYANTLSHINGAMITNSLFKTGTSSVEFDGIGSHIILDPFETDCGGVGAVCKPKWSSHLSFTDKNFTVEGFIYANSFALDGTDRRCIIAGGDDSFYLVLETNGALTWGNDNADIVTTSINLTLNDWIYFSVERFNGVLNIHVDGVAGASVSDSSYYSSFSDYKPSIGAFVDQGGVSSGHYDGNIDCLRITNGKDRGYGLFDYIPVAQPFPVRSDKSNVLTEHDYGEVPIYANGKYLYLPLDYFSIDLDESFTGWGEVDINNSIINFNTSAEDFGSSPFGIKRWFVVGDYVCYMDGTEGFTKTTVGRCLATKVETAIASDWEYQEIKDFPAAGLYDLDTYFSEVGFDANGDAFTCTISTYGIVISTTDGLNWTEKAFLNPLGNPVYQSLACRNVAFINNTYFLLGFVYCDEDNTESGIHAMYSSDLINWTPVWVPLDYNSGGSGLYTELSGSIVAAEYINGRLIFNCNILLGPDAGLHIMSSDDFGLTWTNITPDQLGDWRGLFFHNNILYASRDEVWATSTDGLTWNIFDCSHPNYEYDVQKMVKYANGDVFIRTQGGVVRTTDLINFDQELRAPYFAEPPSLEETVDPEPPKILSDVVSVILSTSRNGTESASDIYNVSVKRSGWGYSYGNYYGA